MLDYVILAILMTAKFVLLVLDNSTEITPITPIALSMLDYSINCTVIICTSAVDTGFLTAAQCAHLNGLIRDVQFLFPYYVHLDEQVRNEMYGECMLL